MLKRIALLGWGTLVGNAQLSVDTVRKSDGIYLHVQVSIFARILIDEKFKISESEKDQKNIIDIDYDAVNDIRNRTLKNIL